MAAKFLSLFILCVMVVGVSVVHGDGECGNTPVEKAAISMAPCAEAGQDESAPVSTKCCDAIKKLSIRKECLCAVMLSNIAKQAGVKPEIAITIPKRCNFEQRPVGYKCGGYTLP
uniref:Bifunctional inhibitor/plant lipid transfer protein/seed storage helical domain-containing protein n=1 Tax=Araucaria cunninghamii TaxID=56994 RepID=A0A0D6R3B3_ARACU